MLIEDPVYQTVTPNHVIIMVLIKILDKSTIVTHICS